MCHFASIGDRINPWKPHRELEQSFRNYFLFWGFRPRLPSKSWWPDLAPRDNFDAGKIDAETEEQDQENGDYRIPLVLFRFWEKIFPIKIRQRKRSQEKTASTPICIPHWLIFPSIPAQFARVRSRVRSWLVSIRLEKSRSNPMEKRIPSWPVSAAKPSRVHAFWFDSRQPEILHRTTIWASVGSSELSLGPDTSYLDLITPRNRWGSCSRDLRGSGPKLLYIYIFSFSMYPTSFTNPSASD